MIIDMLDNVFRHLLDLYSKVDNKKHTKWCARQCQIYVNTSLSELCTTTVTRIVLAALMIVTMLGKW